MPKGVEHDRRRADFSYTDAVASSVMPKGVEHILAELVKDEGALWRVQ